jgi:hypothetical protein
MTLAADIVEHKGSGQRRNRNRLAFLAADQAALEDIQNVVRKKVAWASIVRDAHGVLQLPPAQADDAKKKLAEQEAAALNAVRRGWKHLLLPQETHPGSSYAARGFDLEPVVDIAADTVDGFSEDIENIICDNAASLRITDFGFEKE